MNSEHHESFDPERWNACIRLLSRPLDELDAIQRPAALIFRYDGRVMNGGHSLHFDAHEAASDNELLQALKGIGAYEQARILAEARFLKRGADGETDEERHEAAESIEELDRRYYALKPAIPELLARYFDAHRD